MADNTIAKSPIFVTGTLLKRESDDFMEKSI